MTLLCTQNTGFKWTTTTSAYYSLSSSSSMMITVPCGERYGGLEEDLPHCKSKLKILSRTAEPEPGFMLEIYKS